MVATAAATADPVIGAALMFTFDLARGIPIVAAGTAAGALAQLRHTRGFIGAERAAGALMLAAALYFFYQAAVYTGWLTP